MDPTTTPTPTPNPAPQPMPQPTPAPAPAPAPAAPVAPVVPVTPAEPPIPEPAEAPVYQPGQATTAMPDPTISATDPITMPEPAPEPDPVEEALKQPIRPADPVPGSIGSAVSMPPMGTAPATPSVSFDNPAPAMEPMMTAAPAKKSNKTTIVLLAILGIIIVLGLGAFLVMQLIDQTSNNNTPVAPETPTEEDEEPEKEPVLSSVACKRVLDNAELIGLGNATSGEEIFAADYEDDVLVSLKRGWSLAYEDSTTAKIGLNKIKADYVENFQALEFASDPLTSQYSELDGVIDVTHAIDATNLDEKTSSLFGLSADESQTIDTTKAGIAKTYEALDFTCNEL